MSTTQVESPFEVLAVAHDVSDADLKRAYFRKVREHPPETDADGFHRVHEAFEAIRDPAARRQAAEIARAVAIDPRVLELIEQADEAVNADQRPAALAMLREAVAIAPDFALAREQLITLLISLEAKDEAVAQLRTLITQREDSPELQLLIAQLNISMYEYPIALAALTRARAFSASDRRADMLEVRMLMQMERWNDALALLDDASKRPGPQPHVSDIDVISNRFLVHFERGDLESVESEAKALVEYVARNPSTKGQAIDALNAAASWFLTDRLRSVAITLLEHATLLGAPQTVPLHAPLRMTRAQLSPEARDFLDALPQRVGGHDPLVHLEPESSSVGAAVLAMGFVGSVASMFLSAPAWLLLFVPLMVLGAIRAGRREPSDGARFLCVRPLHLLIVEGAEITVVPLLSVVGISGNASEIRLELRDTPKPMLLRPNESPREVFELISAQIQRLSELLRAGMIETEFERERFTWAPSGGAPQTEAPTNG